MALMLEMGTSLHKKKTTNITSWGASIYDSLAEVKIKDGGSEN